MNWEAERRQKLVICFLLLIIICLGVHSLIWKCLVKRVMSYD